MAGETVRSEAVCLAVRPWSRTSHVVTWLTPSGRIATVVKGAERPKSAFLGQYDVNYTCEIVYYVRPHGGLHALRECSPRCIRESLRRDWRSLALADYCRLMVDELAPSGPECRRWVRILGDTLDALAVGAEARHGAHDLLDRMFAFDVEVLNLVGLRPDFSGWNRSSDYSDFCIDSGSYEAAGRRHIPVSAAAAAYLDGCGSSADISVALDAARVIGVFYTFHLGCATDVRRTILRMISKVKKEKEEL